MLLKRTETETHIECIYDSSNILESSLDKATNNLTITFKSGLLYEYENVSNADYLRFEVADSQGVIFNAKIKTYKTTKLAGKDVKQIIVEADEMKKAEELAFIKGKQLVINQAANDMVASKDELESYNKKAEKLYNLLAEYLKK